MRETSPAENAVIVLLAFRTKKEFLLFIHYLRTVYHYQSISIAMKKEKT
jgi:hypothetical protein